MNTLAGLTVGQSPGDVPAGTIKSLGGANGMTNAEKMLVQDSTYGLRIDQATKSVDLSLRYANPFLTVRDYTPRLIAQTVHSDRALQRLDTVSPGTITDHLVYQITDINTGTARVGGHDVNGDISADGLYLREDIARNLNTLAGDPSLTGLNVLFGQFFSHGLDFIDKGGNSPSPGAPGSKIMITLDPTDPLYSN